MPMPAPTQQRPKKLSNLHHQLFGFYTGLLLALTPILTALSFGQPQLSGRLLLLILAGLNLAVYIGLIITVMRMHNNNHQRHREAQDIVNFIIKSMNLVRQVRQFKMTKDQARSLLLQDINLVLERTQDEETRFICFELRRQLDEDDFWDTYFNLA